MEFWIFMFIMTLLIPFSLLFTWITCPKYKNINNKYGYRTANSMKNQKYWDFAQKECSKNSLKMFFPSLILSIFIMPFTINKNINIISWTGFFIVLVQLLSFIYVIYFTEKSLKNL